MLVFKEGIKGFLYDSQLGGCYDLDCDFEFEFPYSDEGDIDLVVINDEYTLNKMFEVKSQEDLESDEEGLNDFCDWED